MFYFRCDKCGKEFPSHKIVLRHRFTHIMTICEICQKPLQRGSVYRRHLKTFHVSKENQDFECKKCPYKSHANRYLIEHIAKYHDPLKPSEHPWEPHKNSKASLQSVIEKTQMKKFMKYHPEMNTENIIW